MRPIRRIVVHGSATPPMMDIGVREIRRWHLERGWSDIGYHFVIRRNGRIERGRPVEQPGAHAKGYNRDSIGVCLVGGTDRKGRPDANYTYDQYYQLNQLVHELVFEYGVPLSEVVGHRDLPGVRKACPCFDVRGFFSEWSI